MNDRDSSGSGTASAPEDSGPEAAWDGEPRRAGEIRLVLAEDDARVLHAEPGARALVRALAPDGVLPPALARQIGRGPGPRMLRLRLDPRGIAPPTLCRALPGRAADGRGLILLAVIGELPALRAAPARSPGADPVAPAVRVSEPAPEIAPEARTALEPGAPRPGDRFLWRSDAAGALTQLSGGGDALARLVGASWPDLAAAGRLGEAGPFLDALVQRRTFRGLGAVLALDGGLSVAADLSGAPLGRPGQAFGGYGGFGIVRALEARADAGPGPERAPPEAAGSDTAAPDAPEVEAGPRAAGRAVEAPGPVGRPIAAAPEAPAPREPDALAPPYTLAPPFGQGLPADPVAMATMAAPFLAAWLRQDWFGVPAGPAPAQPEPAPEPAPEPDASVGIAPEQDLPEQDLPEPETAPEPEPVAAPEAGIEAESEPQTSALSVSEHDAFREIARALGVRYAGDEAGDETAAPDDPSPRGAVMPFSFAASTAALRSEPDPAALLDGVPGALLLHRESEILAANRALLDLAGYGDLAALRAAGLGRLFGDLSPEPLPADAARDLETRDGTVRRVALARGTMPWPGGPAACLLVRPLPDAPPRLPAPPDSGAADPEAGALLAALDAVAEGLVVVDAAGRVLALNRAAADLVGRDPRAARGAALRDLLPPRMAAALEDPDGGTVALDGHRLAVRGAVLGEGRRAVLLRREAEGRGPESPGFVARFLAQLDREIRTPLTGILGFADVMLKEPYGPLGHARYRSYLSDIRASGEQVLGLVADLVDLATVETGGLPLSRRPLPLNELVSACVAEMQAEAARGRIVLRTSFAEDLAPLEADEPSLARAARLVIGNAIRLTGAGGQVIVSTNPAERGAVALRVRDTGTGMSPEEIAFALEPFRGRPEAGGPDVGNHAGSHAGGGLGLPLSKALVEANDGRLSISSRKDEGTLVEILLPGRAAQRA